MKKNLYDLKIGDQFIFSNSLNIKYSYGGRSGGGCLTLWDYGYGVKIKENGYNNYVIEGDILRVIKRTEKSISVVSDRTFLKPRQWDHIRSNCKFRLPFDRNKKVIVEKINKDEILAAI